MIFFIRFAPFWILDSSHQRVGGIFLVPIVNVGASSDLLNKRSVQRSRAARIRKSFEKIALEDCNKIGVSNRCVFNVYILHTNVFIQFYSHLWVFIVISLTTRFRNTFFFWKSILAPQEDYSKLYCNKFGAYTLQTELYEVRFSWKKKSFELWIFIEDFSKVILTLVLNEGISKWNETSFRFFLYLKYN